jgi:hypothetical protein
MDEATKQRLRNYRIPDEQRARMTPEDIARVEQAMREFADPTAPEGFVVKEKWDEFEKPNDDDFAKPESDQEK